MEVETVFEPVWSSVYLSVSTQVNDVTIRYPGMQCGEVAFNISSWLWALMVM